MAPRRQCPVCHSKEWHKEPSSGLITCSEGHVLQNYRNETREVTELGPHAVRKRTLKSGRKKKGRQSKADAKLYHGERARYHYFQCLQLILRLQVASLTRLWQLPPEFEKACRDIWAMNLGFLPRPPIAEPLLHSQYGKTAGQIHHGTTGEGKYRSKAEEDEQSDSGKSDRTRTGELSAASSDSDSEGSEHDSELEALMRENSESQSTSADERDDSIKRRVSVPVSKKRQTFGRYDVPANTISVLVVALWSLRIPVLYMDFVRLIESYDLPYLDMIALHILPDDMTRHLGKQTVQVLSPKSAPLPLYLHRMVSRLARLMHSSYEIYTPEMNAAPILWKAVRCLQGTPTLYVLTKKLARLVSIPLTLHRSLAPTLARVKRGDPTYHKQDNAIPEVALVGAVIVVVKMVYGLDGNSRGPSCETDPACALPKLSELLLAIRTAGVSAPFYAEEERSALDMDETLMDNYLHFCEKALIPRGNQANVRNATTDQFPVGEDAGVGPEIEKGNPEQEAWSTLTANVIHQTEDGLIPGEQYPIYKTQDILGSLPDPMEFVISQAAQWAGVDEDYVAGVVERFERRVVRWWDGQKRSERGERAVDASD